MRVFLVAGLLLMGAAASAAASTTEPTPPSVISAQNAWVREVPPVAPAAALFVRLHNASTQPVVIRALSSPAAERVEWHDMVMSDGHMRMTQRRQIELPPGETLLQPGASHLMLLGLRKPLRVGDAVPLTLSLANGETLVMSAEVRATRPISLSAKAGLMHEQ